VSNQLGEPLVLHWHGILAPSGMDGIPQSAIASGQSYSVRFPIRNRAGTYFYHAHTDALTGKQVYRGLAGMFIVDDPADDVLGLPEGAHDVPMLITDKRTNTAHTLAYSPAMADVMTGYLGNGVLVNGTPDAWFAVDKSCYRFRWVSASNARVLKLGFSDGRSFRLIATDGGLLPAPVPVTNVTLGPGERVEALVDFSGDATGASITLRSLAFPAGGMGPGPRQGIQLDVMNIYVDSTNTRPCAVPAALASITPYASSNALRTRTFTITASGMLHYINGVQFAPDRLDFTVPWTELERWELVNQTAEFHPMHPHGVHFQVLSRSTGALRPEEGGWKDTVLVAGSETVTALVRFDAYPGRFVFHCHNLEHEDNGMMLNFEVASPGRPVLKLHPPGRWFDWPVWASDWQLESSHHLTNWQSASESPAYQDESLRVVPAGPPSYHFYRLRKP
jgi:FtsP/CotA-like multicopper oxidase with cupredoxin domain